MEEWAPIVISILGIGVAILGVLLWIEKKRTDDLQRTDNLRNEYTTSMCKWLLERVNSLDANYEKLDTFCNKASNYLDRVHETLVIWERKKTDENHEK